MNNSLFNNICGASVPGVNEFKTSNYLKKNQPIFREGGIPRGVFCINKGKVKIFTIGEEGKEQIIHVAKEGEIVGFRALFSDEPYRVSATTLDESNLCFVSKEIFFNLVDTNKALRDSIMKELSTELADRAVFITNMAQKSVRERLAFSLIFLDDVYDGEMINLSRDDLANFVGTATETLIRLLKEFKTDALIKTYARKIKLLDKVTILKISSS